MKGELQLVATLNDKDFLEPGWRRVEEHGRFPTFTTARPSPTPGRKPAGLALCSSDAVQRWRDDQHRFPPYQYRRENCVINSQSQVRVPSVVEREAIMGFPTGYTAKCLPKSDYETERWRTVVSSCLETVGRFPWSHACCNACFGRWDWSMS